MIVDDGAREADAWRQAQATDAGVIDQPPPQPKPEGDTILLNTTVAGFAGFFVVSMVLECWAILDSESGLSDVHKLFDESFGALLDWTLFTTFALPAALKSLAEIDDSKWIKPVGQTVILLSMATAYGYCFATVSMTAHTQASEWQQLPYPVNAAEESIKLAYDTAYCVRVGRETCEDMKVEDATPVFDLTDWTKSASYESVQKLCDANPGNGLAVCKSCEKVKENAKSEDDVSEWSVKKGGYDDGVKWCGLFFGATNVSAEDQSYSPYLYRRTWLLKRLAKNAMDYVILYAITGGFVALTAVFLCASKIQDWRTNRKAEKKNGAGEYAYYVEAS